MLNISVLLETLRTQGLRFRHGCRLLAERRSGRRQVQQQRQYWHKMIHVTDTRFVCFIAFKKRRQKKTKQNKQTKKKMLLIDGLLIIFLLTMPALTCCCYFLGSLLCQNIRAQRLWLRHGRRCTNLWYCRLASQVRPKLFKNIQMTPLIIIIIVAVTVFDLFDWFHAWVNSNNGQFQTEFNNPVSMTAWGVYVCLETTLTWKFDHFDLIINFNALIFVLSTSSLPPKK